MFIKLDHCEVEPIEDIETIKEEGYVMDIRFNRDFVIAACFGPPALQIIHIVVNHYTQCKIKCPYDLLCRIIAWVEKERKGGADKDTVGEHRDCPVDPGFFTADRR